MTALVAFDADVVIYAAAPEHPLGRRVARLFAGTSGSAVGIGSVLLVPEVLGKPLREGLDSSEPAALVELLGRLVLKPLDADTARLAAILAAQHRLRAADAVHLATAVACGADRFLTNNRKDFPRSISEVEIAYPDDLPER